MERTAAHEHDLTPAQKVLYGQEIENRSQMRGRGIKFCMVMRPGKQHVFLDTSAAGVGGLAETPAIPCANVKVPFRLNWAQTA